MARVYVKGYTKSDGTKVEGHYREMGPRSKTGAVLRIRRGAAKYNKTLESSNVSDGKKRASLVRTASALRSMKRVFKKAGTYPVRSKYF